MGTGYRVFGLVAGNVAGLGARSRHRGGEVALAASICLSVVAPAALAGTPPEPEPEPPSPPQVKVSTTGNNSELLKTIPITRGGTERVVMSMTPSRLPALMKGDLLRVTAELQITADCIAPKPRCAGSPYHYNPQLEAKLILARGMGVTGGKDAVSLARPERNYCRQSLPHREHHCMLVFTHGGYEVHNEGELPCEGPHSCYVNVVVEARSPRARPGDVMVVGGNRPNGAILQDKGRINAIRLRPNSEDQASMLKATGRVHGALPPNLSKQVVYSQRLEGLEEGEQLVVDAKMKTDISHLPYATRIGARVILAVGRGATSQGRQAKNVAELNGEISENNGFNCTQLEGSCVTRKVGVLEIKQDAHGPLFVNLVAITGPKGATAGSGDRVKVTRAGFLRVQRYPPELNG